MELALTVLVQFLGVDLSRFEWVLLSRLGSFFYCRAALDMRGEEHEEAHIEQSDIGWRHTKSTRLKLTTLFSLCCPRSLTVSNLHFNPFKFYYSEHINVFYTMQWISYHVCHNSNDKQAEDG